MKIAQVTYHDYNDYLYVLVVLPVLLAPLAIIRTKFTIQSQQNQVGIQDNCHFYTFCSILLQNERSTSFYDDRLVRLIIQLAAVNTEQCQCRRTFLNVGTYSNIAHHSLFHGELFNILISEKNLALYVRSQLARRMCTTGRCCTRQGPQLFQVSFSYLVLSIACSYGRDSVECKGHHTSQFNPKLRDSFCYWYQKTDSIHIICDKLNTV